MKTFAIRPQRLLLGVTLVLLASVSMPVRSAGASLAESAAPQASGPLLVLRAKLLRPPTIASVQNASFPGSIANDRDLSVGSLFSGLFRDPRDPFLAFWAVSDRGPNEDLPVGSETRRTFPLPEFDPTIYRVQVKAGSDSCPEIVVEAAYPLKTTGGRPVTGLPNRPGVDEIPYDWTGQTRLDTNMNGLDTEGIVCTADGNFWLCEEYGPSLLSVGPTGTVRVRYVPVGSGISGAHYPIAETLPALYARRKPNRGFESIAISRDEKRIFAILQSPLLNPTKAVGEASRIVRILAVDRSGKPTAEYVFVAETAASFGEKKQSEMKVSDAAWVNARTLLVDERTDRLARIYAVDFGAATNILGTKWDDAATTPSLEALAPEELAGRGIVPVAKSLVVDVGEVAPDAPQKIEGLAILDRWTVAVGNDNEFDLAGFDGAGNRKPKGSQLSELLVIRLAKPLPLE